jgi:hypothetical protein
MPIVILILLLISATGALTVAGVIDPAAMIDKAMQTIFNTQKSGEDPLSSETPDSPADVAAQSKANGDDAATTQTKVANAAYDAVLAGASKEETVAATIDAGGDTYLTNVRVEEAAQQVANEAAAQEAADQEAAVQKAAQEAAEQQAKQVAADQAEQLRLAAELQAAAEQAAAQQLAVQQAEQAAAEQAEQLRLALELQATAEQAEQLRLAVEQAEQLRLDAELQAAADQAEQLRVAAELQAAQEAAALQAIQYAVQAAEAQAAAEREAALQAEREAALQAEREAEAQAVLQAALEAERERLAAELLEAALQVERDRAAAEVEAAKRQALDMLSAYILNGLSVTEAKALSSVDMYGISATDIQSTIIGATNARLGQLNAVDNVMDEMKSGILINNGFIIRAVQDNGAAEFIEAGKLKAIAAAPNVLAADISRQAADAYAVWETNLVANQTVALNYLYDIMMTGVSESSARLTSKVAQYNTPEVDIMYYVNKANADIITQIDAQRVVVSNIIAEVRTGSVTLNGSTITPQNADQGNAFMSVVYDKLSTHAPLIAKTERESDVISAFEVWKISHIKEKWRPHTGLEFGGMWSNNYNNPSTGAKSCPPGFDTVSLNGHHNRGTTIPNVMYCSKPFGAKPTAGAMRFGGIYKDNKNLEPRCATGYNAYDIQDIQYTHDRLTICASNIPTGIDELAFDEIGVGVISDLDYNSAISFSDYNTRMMFT